jgi:hypothetical protein
MSITPIVTSESDNVGRYINISFDDFPTVVDIKKISIISQFYSYVIIGFKINGKILTLRIQDRMIKGDIIEIVSEFGSIKYGDSFLDQFTVSVSNISQYSHCNVIKNIDFVNARTPLAKPTIRKQIDYFDVFPEMNSAISKNIDNSVFPELLYTTDTMSCIGKEYQALGLMNQYNKEQLFITDIDNSSSSKSDGMSRSSDTSEMSSESTESLESVSSVSSESVSSVSSESTDSSSSESSDSTSSESSDSSKSSESSQSTNVSDVSSDSSSVSSNSSLSTISTGSTDNSTLSSKSLSSESSQSTKLSDSSPSSSKSLSSFGLSESSSYSSSSSKSTLSSEVSSSSSKSASIDCIKLSFIMQRDYLPYVPGGVQQFITLNRSGSNFTGGFSYLGDNYGINLNETTKLLTISILTGGECFAGRSISSIGSSLLGSYPDQYDQWAGCTLGTGLLSARNIISYDCSAAPVSSLSSDSTFSSESTPSSEPIPQSFDINVVSWVSRIDESTLCYGNGSGHATMTLQSSVNGVHTYSGIGPYANENPQAGSGSTTYTLIWDTVAGTVSLNSGAFMFSPIVVVASTPAGTYNQNENGSSSGCGPVTLIGQYVVTETLIESSSSSSQSAVPSVPQLYHGTAAEYGLTTDTDYTFSGYGYFDGNTGTIVAGGTRPYYTATDSSGNWIAYAPAYFDWNMYVDVAEQWLVIGHYYGYAYPFAGGGTGQAPLETTYSFQGYYFTIITRPAVPESSSSSSTAIQSSDSTNSSDNSSSSSRSTENWSSHSTESSQSSDSTESSSSSLSTLSSDSSSSRSTEILSSHSTESSQSSDSSESSSLSTELMSSNSTSSESVSSQSAQPLVGFVVTGSYGFDGQYVLVGNFIIPDGGGLIPDATHGLYRNTLDSTKVIAFVTYGYWVLEYETYNTYDCPYNGGYYFISTDIPPLGEWSACGGPGPTITAI